MFFNFFSESCDDGLDYKLVCGKGATGCDGYVWNVTCECDNVAGYYQAPDGKSCIAGITCIILLHILVIICSRGKFEIIYRCCLLKFLESPE